MSVEPKRLAAIFFVPVESIESDLSNLLVQAGATDITPTTDETYMLHCKWAQWTCRGYKENLSSYQVLYIYFWQSDFLANLDADMKDSDQRLITAFEYACTNLNPDVALIVTHVWQANPEFVLNREWMVLASDGDSLLAEYAGALFLKTEIAELTTLDISRRKVLTLENGKIIFAGNEAGGLWF